MIRVDVDWYTRLDPQSHMNFEKWLVDVGLIDMKITVIEVLDESCLALRLTRLVFPYEIDEDQATIRTTQELCIVSIPFPVHLLRRVPPQPDLRTIGDM